MKTYCKDVDITKRDLISRCAHQCLQGKYTRRDVLELLSSQSGRSRSDLKRAYKKNGANAMTHEVEVVIDTVREELVRRELILKPIRYLDKLDSSSNKTRRIGIQDIKQQIYDYIAVEGLRPILRRIGEYQCASIPGRGQKYGIQAVQRWMRNPHIRYAAKLDIQKCFESIEHGAVMAWLRKRVRNDTLLWLIETLLLTFEQGLSIGSFLSQYLCNLYLSDLYHYASESLYRIRRRRRGGDIRVNLISHVLFYMDDILLLGTNAKDLHRAVDLICDKARAMKLRIKKTWRVFSVQGAEFVDMMGVRIYKTHTTIRDYVFRRIRRAYTHALRRIKQRLSVSGSLARRCASYYGLLKNTDSYKLRKKWQASLVMRVCKGVISRESKILASTAAA